MCGSASVSPVTVRQGLNHSRPEVRVPRRASFPSETTSASFMENRDGQLGFVGLELVPGRPDGGVLVGRVLQFDHAQRQAVDEQHYVRPAGVLVLGDGELVDGKPVVVGRVFEVDDADLIPAHCALGIAVLDLDSVDEHAVEGAIAGFDGRALRAYQLAECVVERFDRQAGVQSGQGVPEPKIQHHLSVVAALCNGRVGGDVRSLSNLPAQVGKP